MAIRTYTKDRTCRVEIRLTPKERANLEEQAEQSKLTLSELLRRRATGKVVLSRYDETMINEMRRQGGLLKHIAGQYPAERQAFQQALDELTAAFRRVP
jgi:hypothetical protein